VTEGFPGSTRSPRPGDFQAGPSATIRQPEWVRAGIGSQLTDCAQKRQGLVTPDRPPSGQDRAPNSSRRLGHPSFDPDGSLVTILVKDWREFAIPEGRTSAATRTFPSTSTGRS